MIPVRKQVFVMAASISQTRYDYKISFQEAIRDGKIVPVAFEKCPLCYENRRLLSCDTCVNTGGFSHTQRRDCGSFKEKRQEWFTKLEERRTVVQSFESSVHATERANAKKTEIELTRKKILLLKKAIQETKSKCDTERIQLSRNKKERRSLRSRLEHNQLVTLPNLKLRVASLSEQPAQNSPTIRDLDRVKFNRDFDVKHLISVVSKSIPLWQQQGSSKQPQEGTSIDPKSIPVLHNELHLYNQYLATHRGAFVRILSQRIFPIHEVLAMMESNLEMSMATALKDASETAFIAGRWVHVDLRGENHCKIIDSTLPEYSGESSALGLFVMANRYASENPDKIPVGNPSYGIQSALGYTTIFTSLAAHVLDVHLPRRCSIRELRDDITEQDFCNYVWRLHQNILQLAHSQGVDPRHLVDYLSLRNLLLVLDSPTLGSVGSYEASYTMPVKAELCPLEYESEEETEKTGTDMDVSKDWERVPSGLPSVESTSMAESAPIDTSTTGALLHVATSITGWIKSYYK